MTALLCSTGGRGESEALAMHARSTSARWSATESASFVQCIARARAYAASVAFPIPRVSVCTHVIEPCGAVVSAISYRARREASREE
jgi:hypothetical protein